MQEATVAQVRAVVVDLVAAGQGTEGDRPIILVTDAGYDPARLAWQLGDLPVVVCSRVRSDRVYYGRGEPKAPGAVGPRPQARVAARMRQRGLLGGPRRRGDSVFGPVRAGPVAVLAVPAPEAHRKVGAGRPRGAAAGRRRDRGAAGGRPPAPPEQARSGELVDFAGRSRSGRDQHGLVRLAAPLRPGAPPPLHQAGPGLDCSGRPRPARRRRLDSDRDGRLPATMVGPQPRRRPSPALGTARTARAVLAPARPPRIAQPPRRTHPPRQCRETRPARPRPAQRRQEPSPSRPP
nr:transposase [Glycomyces sp. TRM65418]